MATARYNCQHLGYFPNALLTTKQPHLVIVVGSKIETPPGGTTRVLYAVWTMNLEQDNRECLNSGRYGLEALEDAYKIAMERI